MTRHVIGIDVGTTALKALLVDASGRIAASATRAYPWRAPRPGWSEQDPEHWWEAAMSAVRDLTAQLPSGRTVAALGLSGQMHGSVFLGEKGDVLYPAILWNDQRTAAQCERINALTRGQIEAWTLNPPRTAFTASKILWLLEERPSIAARIKHVLLPKDYLRFRLTGSFASDVSDASGTLLLDVRARAWSESALSALSIPASWLPAVVESCDPTGTVTAEAASACGLAAGTPVVGGAADQAAAAIGNGVTRPGIVSLTIGTSGVVYAQISEVTVDPSGAFHTFCHAVPGTWQMMAGVLAAGGSLRWYRDVVADTERSEAQRAGSDPYDVIARDAERVGPGADGLVFLPYLTGERSPHNDPAARGGWFGLTARHERAHLARAVVEGACFALRDLVDLLAALGVPVDALRVAGGGAQSGLWLRVLTDVLGRPLSTTTTVDASAYGAAILAAAHAFGERVERMADDWVRVATTVEPNPRSVETYEGYYRVFADVYPATRGLMHRLTSLASRPAIDTEAPS